MCDQTPNEMHADVDVVADAAFVVEHARDVRVRADRAPAVATRLHAAMTAAQYGPATWHLPPMHPQEATDATVDWYRAAVRHACTRPC
jgi:hypothetical protein